MYMCRYFKILLSAILTVALTARTTSTALANPIIPGDLFAAVDNGKVQHYNSSGSLFETLDTGLGGFTTGMAFDAAGDLYVTGWSANAVSKFSAATSALLGTFGTGYSTPESIVFDSAGNAYVSSVGGAGIKKLNASGTTLIDFAIGRTDWLDLAADQKTIFYTREDDKIYRFDTSTGTFLPDLASGLSHTYALRILSDGTVLVADTVDVKRLNSAGSVIQTYNVAGPDHRWFALNLINDGTSFVSGDAATGKFYKFNIATGALLQTVDTGVGQNHFFGLTVAGEITAAQPPGVPEPASLALLSVGVLGVFGYAWRKRK